MEDKDLLEKYILKFIEKASKENVDLTFVSGGCKQGADHMAEELAEKYNIPIIIHYPDKSQMKDDSRNEYVKQLFARNTLVARDSDVLIALVAKDRKGGTEDTLKKFKAMGKQTEILL